MLNSNEITAFIERDLPPFKQKLHSTLIKKLVDDFIIWQQAVAQEVGRREPFHYCFVDYLSLAIQETSTQITELRKRYSEFNKRYSGATTNQEKKEHILNFSEILGASPRQLSLDKRAFSRWFGADALTDRYQKKNALLERKITFCLELLGTVTAEVFRSMGEDGDCGKFIRRFKTESIVRPSLEYDGESRVRIEAFRCLAKVLKTIPEKYQKESVSENMLKFVFQAALDRRQQIWIRCEALQLLERLSLESLFTALNMSLSKASTPDDIFVRSRAVRILGDNLKRLPSLYGLVETISSDPSPFVRQALVDILDKFTGKDLRTWSYHLVMNDPAPQVRAAALLKVLSVLNQEEHFDFFLALINESLETEADTFVLRVCLKVSCDGLFQIIEQERKDSAGKWYETLLGSIEKLHCESDNISVKRWAAQSREKMWCELDPQARQLKQLLTTKIKDMKPGQSKRLPRSLFSDNKKDFLGRVLSVLCLDDFPCEIKLDILGGLIIRGHKFCFRFWRFFHEIFNPSPDKRQAFSHTTGRKFKGTIHCPSGIMCELTPTKVPGEPVLFPDESGWRPYLPLPDEILSSLENSFFYFRSTKIYSSEGITEIKPPRLLPWRLWAKAVLNLKYKHFTRLRNWLESDQIPPSSYVNALRKLGFQIQIKNYLSNNGEICLDPKVTRFFQ